MHDLASSVFRILILRVPSVNRIFPLRVLTAGAISLFLNITGAIAPMAPVLNTPLHNSVFYWSQTLNSLLQERRSKQKLMPEGWSMMNWYYEWSRTIWTIDQSVKMASYLMVFLGKVLQ